MNPPNTNAFGIAVGSGAAHLHHFVCRGATALVTITGDTGRGMAHGAKTTAAVRLDERRERAAKREALSAPRTPIGVTITA